MKRIRYRAAALVLSLACAAASPVTALAENPQFAHDEATWARLRDNVMEYDELQMLADLILSLEQLDTAFHGMYEDEVVDGREHLMLQLVVVGHFLMLHVEIGGDVLTTELIAHLHGALGIAKTNAEGIPADEGVVGFFDDIGRSACVGDTGCLHRFYHRFAHHLCLTQQHA